MRELHGRNAGLGASVARMSSGGNGWGGVVGPLTIRQSRY